MKICLIANPNSPHTHRWIKNFIELGHKLYLIGEHPLQRKAPLDCEFFNLTESFNLRKLRYLVWPMLVRRYLKLHQPDILHSFGVTSAGWLGAASGFHPFLVTAHGSDLLQMHRRSLIHKLLSKWVIKKSDHMICVSQELAQMAVELGATISNIDVIHLGIDTKLFAPNKINLNLREELGFSSSPLVLNIRPVAPVYRPLDLANAIPLILDQYPFTQFGILTFNRDPDTLRLFKEIVQKNNSSNSIRYIGELPDDQAVADHYRIADICVSISESDGTPNSVLEAMACGSALVVSDLVSLHDWIHHEIEALFVPVGNVKAIADAIIRLISESNLRYQLGQNAKIAIRDRGDSEYWTNRSLEVYQQVIMKTPRGSAVERDDP